MHLRYILAFSLLLSSSVASAINVLSINTEQQQGQKAITGNTVNTTSASLPTPDEVEAYKALILNSKSDIVGLTESPQKRIAEPLAQSLAGDWQLILREDRNSTSGVRVSILSRLPLIEGSVSNLSEQYGYSRHEKHRSKPDAVIAAGFELDDKSYYVVTAYLTSGAGDYAEVRYAQADAVRNALFKNCKDSYTHCLTMGNMNDEPGSQAVKRIQGVDGMFGDKIALHQAELAQGSGPLKTYGEGRDATQGNQILSTLLGTASTYTLSPKFSAHKAILLISREPFKTEKPSKKIKRDMAKLAAYYKQQHLEELVEKQKTYIEALEIENAILTQQLSTTQ